MKLMRRPPPLTHLLGITTAMAVLVGGSCPAGEPAKSGTPPKPAPREPDRRELWVPSESLEEVLRDRPGAVLLTPEEYETLVRDAGRVSEEDLKDGEKVPVEVAVESVRLRGKVEPGATEVLLHGELDVHVLGDGWGETSLLWELEMTSVKGDGRVLLSQGAKKSPQKPKGEISVTSPDALRIHAQGPGVHRIRFESVVPVLSSFEEGFTGIDLPVLGCEGVLELELPTGASVRRSSPFTVSGTVHRFLIQNRQVGTREEKKPLGGEVSVVMTSPIMRSAMVRWGEVREAGAAAAMRWARSGTASYELSEMAIRGEWQLTGWMMGRGIEKETIRLPLVPKGVNVQVESVSGANVTSWEQRGDMLHLVMDRDLADRGVTVSLRRGLEARGINEDDTGVNDVLPGVDLNDEVVLAAEVSLAEGLEILDVEGALEPSLGESPVTFSFGAGAKVPSLRHRRVKPRIEADVDGVVRLERDSVGVERTVALRTDRPFLDVTLVLPEGEELNEVTAEKGPALEWKRVDRTVEVRFAEPVTEEAPARVKVSSRKKLGRAWSGAGIAEDVVIANLGILEAVKVAGYTALDFDDAWKVSLGAVRGLEDRDARLTPVTGRMVWFGLRDWELPFTVERGASVYSAEVTAYALPRSRTVEIEGQVRLDISGAPLRTFQMGVPPEIASLLRWTSPLVGEQTLAAETGLWTCTLAQETMGRPVIRFRMSLPALAGKSGRTQGGDGPDAPPKSTPLAADLPEIVMPEARRFQGTWVIEANTDTELSLTPKSMQPMDVLRVPAVEDYQPRHRIVAAYRFGSGSHGLRIDARRHAHSEMAALVILDSTMRSVLGTDGASFHEARLTLQHSGEQFVALRLPEGAALLSTTVNGEAVKPVRGPEGSVAVPLPGHTANAAETRVTVQYRLAAEPWSGRGRLVLEPTQPLGEVPVLHTRWEIHAPEGWRYTHGKTTLKLDHENEPVALLSSAAAYMSSPALSGIADREVARRVAQVEDARANLEEGDDLMAEGDYEAALAQYRAAVDGIPNAPLAAQWKSLAQTRQADGCVALARAKAKAGEYDEAAKLLDEALELDPDHAQAGTLKSHLNDPDRWPSALSPEEQNRVREVQKFLWSGHSASELGDYDEANRRYADVLRLDPYNTAARRGMERVEMKRSQYFDSARDHQRSRMLNAMNEAWEDRGDQPLTDQSFGSKREGTFLTAKQNEIILPELKLDNVTIEEAVESLRRLSREFDEFEQNPAKKGINVILRTGDIPITSQISLDLKDVPFMEALRYVTELAGMKYKIESYAVIITPLSDTNAEQVTRSFKVPPNFLSGLGGDAAAPAASADPFASAPASSTSSLIQRQTALEILASQGIPFPEGASAVFNPVTSQLIVKNTQSNLDLIETFNSSLLSQPRPSGPPPIYPEQFRLSELSYERDAEDDLRDQMNQTVFPEVRFDRAPLGEVLEWLVSKSRDFDSMAQGTRELPLRVEPGTDVTQPITLELTDIPMSEALRYAAELAGMKYVIRDGEVVIVPLSDTWVAMEERVYAVPTDVWKSVMGEGQSTQDVFESQGIPFPEGASAELKADGKTLVVRNSEPNLTMVETFLASLWNQSKETPPRSLESLRSEMKRESLALLPAIGGDFGMKEGLIPLEVDLPQAGRVLVFSGHQRPESLSMRFVSWERLLVEACGWMLAGAGLFWWRGRRRPWRATLLVVAILAGAVPVWLSGWMLAANAVLFGWLVTLVVWTVWRVLTGWLVRGGDVVVVMEQSEPGGEHARA